MGDISNVSFATLSLNCVFSYSVRTISFYNFCMRHFIHFNPCLLISLCPLPFWHLPLIRSQSIGPYQKATTFHSFTAPSSVCSMIALAQAVDIESILMMVPNPGPQLRGLENAMETLNFSILMGNSFIFTEWS